MATGREKAGLSVRPMRLLEVEFCGCRDVRTGVVTNGFAIHLDNQAGRSDDLFSVFLTPADAAELVEKLAGPIDDGRVL